MNENYEHRWKKSMPKRAGKLDQPNISLSAEQETHDASEKE
jgi:hypothetical protein